MVNMKEFLNKGIKEVIDQYPEIGKILDEYSIGCTSCGVGTCLLKDIVEIHNLPSVEEQEMMADEDDPADDQKDGQIYPLENDDDDPADAWKNGPSEPPENDDDGEPSIP